MSKVNHNICPVAKWKRRKEARPGEILDAAMKVFCEKGFAATRLDDVACLAGVSKGTVYLYFDNKEALFTALVNEMVLPVVKRAETLVDNHTGSAASLIKVLVEQWQENVIATKLSGIPKLIISEAGNFPELGKFYIEKVIQRGRKIMSRVIEKGIETGEFVECDASYVSRVMLAPMVFTAVWERSLAGLDDDKYSVEKFFQVQLDLMLNGLKKTS